MGRRGYPPELRRRVLVLMIETGRTFVEVARDLDVSQQTIYIWRRQDRLDRGLEPCLKPTTTVRPLRPSWPESSDEHSGIPGRVQGSSV